MRHTYHTTHSCNQYSMAGSLVWQSLSGSRVPLTKARILYMRRESRATLCKDVTSHPRPVTGEEIQAEESSSPDDPYVTLTVAKEGCVHGVHAGDLGGIVVEAVPRN